MQLKISTKNEDLIAYLMFFQLIISNVRLLLLQLGISMGILNAIAFGGAYFFGIACIIRSLNKRTGLLLIILLTIALLLSYITNSNASLALFYDDGTGQILLSNIFTFMFLYFPVFLLLSSSEIELTYLLNKMGRLAFINTLLFILIFLLNFFRPGYRLEFMNFAYSALFTIFFCFYLYKKTETKKYLVCFILGAAFILLGGSRGALFAVLLFVFLFLLLGTGEKSLKHIAFIILISLVVLVVFLNFNAIISSLAGYLESHGYNSRVLRLISGEEGGFFHYEDRANIQAPIIEHLSDRFFGYGLFGDRYFCGYNGYAHNWLLEVLIDFGWLVGSIFIFAIVFSIIRTGVYAVKSKNFDLMFLWISTICLTFVKYMFSSSFLHSNEMMFVLGILLSINSSRCLLSDD